MVTEHFTERLIERTPYDDVETFWSDIKNKKESIVKLNKNSKELRFYPQLRHKFRNYPNSTLWVLGWMGVVLVTDNRTLITLLNI